MFNKLFKKSIQRKIIFEISDYDLNLKERRAKFKEFVHILCEKCNKIFYHDSSYCNHCYNKENSEEERNRMLSGRCKKCFQACTDLNWCSACGFQNFVVFKISDYDLNINERKVKFKDYDVIICGKCKQRSYFYFYCDFCLYKENNEEERNRMLYGRCKKCFQICTNHDQCSACGFQSKNIAFFKTSDYDLDLRERRAKFKDFDHILCEECNKILYYNSYCKYCYDKETNDVKKNNMRYKGCKECFKELYGCLSCGFQQDFNKWTSGNKNIDELIQESQISARDLFGILEWIPYDKFTDIKFIDEGGFAKVYSATWTDGYIVDRSEFSSWKKYGSVKVALKVLNNSSENISQDFLNEIKGLKKFPNVYSGVVTFYGITQEPTTHNYALVFKLEDSGLRYYLNKNYNLLTWERRRLIIIQFVCSGLRSIHSYDLIHKDLHIGNILHSILNNHSFTYIGDFGFCMPANEISSKSNIYGVMPYMAPEILRRKPYTKASDIYSLGIVINEIISITLPFNKEPHDHYLALDICRGRRPKIREETPEFLKELIKKCWDANLENRPSSDEIETLISNFRRSEEFNELSYNSITMTISSSETQLFETHPQAIYTSRLLSLSDLLEPVNCQNQDEFGNIVQVQTVGYAIWKM